MLCQFSVKNFRCIKDELTLDMQATDINEHTEKIIQNDDGESFLPLAALYGPNGAGKSTVIEALSFLIDKITTPINIAEGKTTAPLLWNKENNIPPFKFSEDTKNSPTEFEIFFRTKHYEYQYQISIDKNGISSESLSRKKILGQRYILIFSRKKNIVIKLSHSLQDYKTSGLSPQLPLLSYFAITYKDNSVIKDVINWFNNQIIKFNVKLELSVSAISHWLAILTKELKIKNLILSMLKEMNIDIDDFRMEKESKSFQIFTKHVIENKDYELSLIEESDGTLKIFKMLPYIILSLSTGATFLVDELDSKLHPKLLQYIISLYNDKQKNPRGAQLIFTSHDLATMNNKNFRRDEIWFVAKGRNQGSVMYSLVEIKKSENDSYDQQYLKGRYGADPYLQKIIQWEEFHDDKEQSQETAKNRE